MINYLSVIFSVFKTAQKTADNFLGYDSRYQLSDTDIRDAKDWLHHVIQTYKENVMSGAPMGKKCFTQADQEALECLLRSHAFNNPDKAQEWVIYDYLSKLNAGRQEDTYTLEA